MSKLKLFTMIYLVGALVDDVLTYLYVKLWGIYAEANPIVAIYWMDKPLSLWIFRDLFSLILLIATSAFYRKVMDILIRRSEKTRSKALNFLSAMRRAWMFPLALAAAIRCLAAVHDVLLIAFGYETPLSELVRKMFPSPPRFLGLGFNGDHGRLAMHFTWALLQPDFV